MVADPLGQKSSQKTIAMEERNRLACALHDGLLQSLTGIALQLEALHRLLVKGENNGVCERLEAVQILVWQEQIRLRDFIQQLKDSPQTAGAAKINWDIWLSELVQQIELEWGLPVLVSRKNMKHGVARGLAKEIYHLVREALINSARHAGAAQALVEVDVKSDSIDILVKDNGRGFPFQGRYELSELMLLGWGPKSLKERISALHGHLVLESSCAGSCLEMSIPVRRRIKYQAE